MLRGLSLYQILVLKMTKLLGLIIAIIKKALKGSLVQVEDLDSTHIELSSKANMILPFNWVYLDVTSENGRIN